MRKLAFCFCLTALCSFTALAQTRGQLSKNFLKGKHIIHTHPNPSAFKGKGNIPAPHGFPAGVDTITNFTGHFQAQGIYPIRATAGINHNVWEYSMVGNPPDRGGTTVINAPVIPVTVDMRNPDGSPAFVTTTAQNCPTCTPAQLGQNIRLIAARSLLFVVHERTPVPECGLHQQSGSDADNGRGTAGRVWQPRTPGLAHTAFCQSGGWTDHGFDTNGPSGAARLPFCSER